MFQKVTGDSIGASLVHQTAVATDDIKSWHELERLRIAHTTLDQQIKNTSQSHLADPLLLQRMKREKLRLKEVICMMESVLYPNLIA